MPRIPGKSHAVGTIENVFPLRLIFDHLAKKGWDENRNRFWNRAQILSHRIARMNRCTDAEYVGRQKYRALRLPVIRTLFEQLIA